MRLQNVILFPSKNLLKDKCNLLFNAKEKKRKEKKRKEEEENMYHLHIEHRSLSSHCYLKVFEGMLPSLHNVQVDDTLPMLLDCSTYYHIYCLHTLQSILHRKTFPVSPQTQLYCLPSGYLASQLLQKKK